MSQPKIADTKPMVMELEAGDYYWCTCGQSTNQPFCDGKHKGSEFVPQKFTLEKTQKVAMCLCKQTQNPPFCDGAHAKI